MKSFLFVLISILMMPYIVHAEYQIGDYFQIGTYRGEPIIWRYVAEDENGKLLLSDKILGYKRFGQEFRRKEPWQSDDSLTEWVNSPLRVWLNSTAYDAQKFEWPVVKYYDLLINVGFSEEGEEIYGGESGFLTDSNFSTTQKNLMKNTTQWTMLPRNSRADSLKENNSDYFYNVIRYETYIETRYHDISDLPKVYRGIGHNTTDRIFLLDEIQLYNVLQNLGSVMAKSSFFSAGDNPEKKYLSTYWLRSPSSYDKLKPEVAIVEYEDYRSDFSYKSKRGIRPAFYLKESAIASEYGSGKIYDPYILDGTLPITVYYGENEILFDQEPIIENDRVLVPMRAIFEKLGTEVEWDEESETITATQGDNSVTMQVGNSTLVKNGEEIIIDTPPQIVNGRTLVPVRAVSESLDAEVDWNSYITRVIITK